MSKAKARVFVPLIKVDEEQRLVYGRITAEELDQSGEVMDYDTSKPNFEKWSSDIEQASGGLSKGNLRVMHGLSVAGKLTDLAMNDEDKSIEVCAKVVDDAEWLKVTEGCYTGFSVGGKYGKKWKATNDNGDTITKYTAVPNEVSLVDNPCVKSATFALVKADGATEEVEFLPLKKAAEDETAETETPTAEETVEAETAETPEEKVEKADHQVPVPGEPSAQAIAEKAGDLAKAANDGSTWQDHIAAAREQLMKGDSPLSLAAEQEREKANEGSNEAETSEDGEEREGDDDASADTDAEPGEGDPAEKVTPPGVKQSWTTSDGQAFEKKADAVAHEEELQKATAPKTAAEELRERLNKATNPDEPVEEATPLIEDFDRLAKAVNALSTPFDEQGQPALQKGMYTINRFSSVLSDMASLSRSIKAEGKREGDDATDSTVSDDIIAAVKTLGSSFITYATDQVQELLAGMDDDVVVSYHDYYYNAVQTDPENGLAKDVVGLITDFREPSRERRDELAKAFGMEQTDEEPQDEMTPALKKRFDALEAENGELKKVAEEAIAQVEGFAERLKKVEDTPLPRAPRNIAHREGDNTFLGKTANTAEEQMAVLHDMLKTKGPDALATELIKLAQSNPQQLHLRGQ